MVPGKWIAAATATSPGTSFSGAARVFHRIDTDGDGLIDPQEAAAATDEMTPRIQPLTNPNQGKPDMPVPCRGMEKRAHDAVNIGNNGNPVATAALVERRQPSSFSRPPRSRVKDEMAKVVVGQDEIIDFLLIGLLCRGHVLLHGVPGTGKDADGAPTLADARHGIPADQFTPDLMPSDITGTDMINDRRGGIRWNSCPAPCLPTFCSPTKSTGRPPDAGRPAPSHAGRKFL